MHTNTHALLLSVSIPTAACRVSCLYNMDRRAHNKLKSNRVLRSIRVRAYFILCVEVAVPVLYYCIQTASIQARACRTLASGHKLTIATARTVVLHLSREHLSIRWLLDSILCSLERSAPTITIVDISSVVRLAVSLLRLQTADVGTVTTAEDSHACAHSIHTHSSIGISWTTFFTINRGVIRR